MGMVTWVKGPGRGRREACKGRQRLCAHGCCSLSGRLLALDNDMDGPDQSSGHVWSIAGCKFWTMASVRVRHDEVRAAEYRALLPE
jgi:hypothetical protein